MGGDQQRNGRGSTPGSAAATGGPPAVGGRRLLRRSRTVLNRFPFTSGLLAAILAASGLAGLLGHPIRPDQLARWGFGWEDLAAGHLWRLVSAPLLILEPYMALTISAIVLFLVGGCELLLRSRRTAIVFAAGHVAGYAGALAILRVLGALGWEAAGRMGAVRDVGASNGAFGAAGALLVFLPTGLRVAGLFGLGAYLAGALLIEQRIWDLEHILALATGLTVGGAMRARDDRNLAGPRLGGDVLHRQRPLLMAWLVGGMGLVNIAASVLLPHHAGFARLENLLPLGPHHGPRMLLVFSGLLMLVVAGGLGRARRAAWWTAFLAMLLTLGLQLELGVNKLEAVFALAFLLLLVVWKEHFPAPVDPISLARARTRAPLVFGGVPLAFWLAALALRDQYGGYAGPLAALVDVLRRLVYLPPLTLAPVTRPADWLLEAVPLVFWSGLLVLAVLGLRSLRMPRQETGAAESARRLALEHGSTGTSFMATREGNHLYLGPRGGAFMAYRLSGGFAVALGDPVGPAAERADTLAAFTSFCRDHGWLPVVLGATGAISDACVASGFPLLRIGEEAVIDLGALEFKGRKWQNMRTALNRARKEGLEFRLYQGGEVPLLLDMQMRDLEQTWHSGHRLPPLQFTQGRVDDVRDPAVEVAVAVDADGVLHGYVDWLPVPAGNGWVIDLMRRSPDAMNGVMEFLIGMSLLAFQQRGAAFASLAAAPLADIDQTGNDALVPQLMAAVFDRFDTFYDFRSLFDFKDRFEPRWEPVHLAYGDPSDLPAIALAILRCHLPDVGWSQAVRLLGEALAGRLGLTAGDERPRS